MKHNMRRIGTDKEDQGNDFYEEELTFHVDIPKGEVVRDGNAIILKAGDGDAADTP